MKPLMIVLFVQPALTLLFYGTYCSNYILLYSFLTILNVYFGFCIRNLFRINGYESEIINDISYQKIDTLDDVTFDVSNPEAVVN